MNKIAAIVVTYKDTEEKLAKLETSLINEGLKKENIYFRVNDKDNVGYGEGINRILRDELDNYDAFLILNPDIEIKRFFLLPLFKTLEENKAIGIVGPKILDHAGRIWSMGGEIDRKRYSGGLISYEKKDKMEHSISYPDFVSGTAMLIKKEIFKKIGLFQKDYFLYYEDVDFCLRAKKAGFQCAINPRAEMTHFASSTTGKDSPLMQYYMARNHLLFVERFAPIRVKMREIARLSKTLYEARNRHYELMGIRDYFLRRFYKNDNWR
jgi:GT2 family glycosyltransferase